MGASMQSGGGRRGRRGSRNSTGFAEINITPFVDVMLVLLIIFMVTAPMMTSGIVIDLPKTKSSALGGNDEPISVTIKRDGSVYIQNTEIPADSVGPKLKAILGEKVETRIFVRGDTAVDYGNVMKVISQVTLAGYSKVALLTDQSGVKK